MIDVFIIDDHPAIIEGIEFLLSDENNGVRLAGSAETIEDALLKLATIAAEVIILDLYLGTASPIENLVRIKNAQPNAAVMVYSAENAALWQYRMFKAGANAYICKGERIEVFLSTIKKIADNSLHLTGNMTEVFNQFPGYEEADSFSLEELDMVSMLARGKSLKEIAKLIGKSISIVEKRLARIREKAKATSNAHLVSNMYKWRMIDIS